MNYKVSIYFSKKQIFPIATFQAFNNFWVSFDLFCEELKCNFFKCPQS